MKLCLFFFLFQPATKKKSKNVAALFSSKQKKKKEQEGAVLEYMSPDEVAALQRVTNIPNDFFALFIWKHLLSEGLSFR